MHSEPARRLQISRPAPPSSNFIEHFVRTLLVGCVKAIDHFLRRNPSPCPPPIACQQRFTHGDDCDFGIQGRLLRPFHAQRLFSRHPIHPCSREYWRTFESSFARWTFSLKTMFAYMTRSSPRARRRASVGLSLELNCCGARLSKPSEDGLRSIKAIWGMTGDSLSGENAWRYYCLASRFVLRLWSAEHRSSAPRSSAPSRMRKAKHLHLHPRRLPPHRNTRRPRRSPRPAIRIKQPPIRSCRVLKMPSGKTVHVLPATLETTQWGWFDNAPACRCCR